MNANEFTTNPETGRSIRVNGALFRQLLYDRYDYINGELVIRANAPPPEIKRYFFNTLTNRRIIGGGRRYYDLIHAGWEIEEDYYLVPPEVISSDLAHAEALLHSHASSRPPTYERIMAVHRERLTNLNITLCRECLSAMKLEDGEYCDDCLEKKS
jgi:hypothetical protein